MVKSVLDDSRWHFGPVYRHERSVTVRCHHVVPGHSVGSLQEEEEEEQEDEEEHQEVDQEEDQQSCRHQEDQEEGAGD